MKFVLLLDAPREQNKIFYFVLEILNKFQSTRFHLFVLRIYNDKGSIRTRIIMFTKLKFTNHKGQISFLSNLFLVKVTFNKTFLLGIASQ